MLVWPSLRRNFLRALRLYHTASVRCGTVSELCHKDARRLSPLSLNGRRHTDHRPLSEKRVSKRALGHLLTVLALSDELRTLDAAAQIERAARRPPCFDSGTRGCCGRATVKELVSSASAPGVPR